MDKNALIEKINSIEGLTDDERTALTDLLRERKKYGLVWEDKTENVEERLRDNLPVLREVPSRAIISDAPDAPNHILIEGDNLEALTALTYTHSGRIDVIYIDPPYNTGKEFIYNDKLIDNTDGFSHSKWLSFMSKRLLVAKILLKDTGCVIISIDDNEQAQLKLLLDEIFGSANFIADFCVIRAEGGGLAKQVIKGHDYCFVYAKDINNFTPLARQKDVRGKIVQIEGISYWIQEDWLRKQFGKYGNCHYEEIVEYKGSQYKQEIDEGLSKGLYTLIPKPNGMNIVGKLRRLDSDSSKFYSVLKHLNKEGVNELKELNVNFDYPKPLSLIKNVVSGATFFNRCGIILDFFAGSGTTLHATMQLNKEDGGKRQCILVTNNENNICEEVTYVRNKRVIEGYTTPKGERIEGLTANSLRYYKTELLPREQTVRNKRRLMNAATDLLCIKNDLYSETDEFGGKPLNKNAARCFAEGKRMMLVIYNELTVDTFAEAIRGMDVEERIMIYVFSLSPYPQTDNFQEVLDKVELCALPAAIYAAYRHVLPDREKRKRKMNVTITNEGGQKND